MSSSPDLKRTVWAIEATLNSLGWSDEGEFEPTIFVLLPDSNLRGGLMPWPVPINSAAWEIGPPNQALHFIARLVKHAGVPEMVDSVAGVKVPMRDAVGMAISVEAWAVTAHSEDVAKVDQIKAAARDRTLHEMPDKFESRIVLGVLFDEPDDMIVVSRRRDTDKPMILGGTLDIGDGGDIPRAFSALVQTYAQAIGKTP